MAGESTTVRLTASAGDDRTVTVLVDQADADRLAGRRISLGSHGYAQIYDHGKRVLLHRWIVGLGPGGTKVVDHINRRPLDCRRSNLRAVSQGENNLNRALPDRELPRGVYPSGKRYVAKLKRHSRTRHLGTYDTPEQAAAAVLEARRAIDRPEFITDAA